MLKKINKHSSTTINQNILQKRGVSLSNIPILIFKPVADEVGILLVCPVNEFHRICIK